MCENTDTRDIDHQNQTLLASEPEATRPTAEEVMHEAKSIKLSKRDSLVFANALINAQAPNERLRVAFAQYREETEEH